jgi:purine-cytosine permease-like protein
MLRTLPKLAQQTLVIVVGVPVVGVLMGGIYWLPATRITKGREPWLSLLLVVGLAATVIGIGRSIGEPLSHLAIVLAIALFLLLLARGLFGSFDRLERFGILHVATLVSLMIASAVTRANHPSGLHQPDAAERQYR